MAYTLFLFGEAEKGELCTPFACHSLPELALAFGNPPEDSEGIFYAVQALLYGRDLIYFRVKEEGFSIPDYMKGLKFLEETATPLSAICMPGMGDEEIINSAFQICTRQKSMLIVSERDLYDYLTVSK